MSACSALVHAPRPLAETHQHSSFQLGPNRNTFTSQSTYSKLSPETTHPFFVTLAQKVIILPLFRGNRSSSSVSLNALTHQICLKLHLLVLVRLALSNMVAAGHGALAAWLVWIEMCCKYKIYPGFWSFSMKSRIQNISVIFIFIRIWNSNIWNFWLHEIYY